MKKELIDKFSLDDHVGCFGNFNLQDPVCKRLCALNLSCAINRNQNIQTEILEDLLSGDGMFMKIQ